MAANFSIHRAISVRVVRRHDTGTFWTDLYITDDEGNEYEVTLFTTDGHVDFEFLGDDDG